MKDYTIGVLTYVGRYENYLKPLVKQLSVVFPDKDIVFFINGHHDLEKQICYLKGITEFLSHYKNMRYVTNEEHQPLSKGWNWLFLLAKADNVLVLNDDVKITPLFRYSFEKQLRRFDHFIINGSWSHFLFSKKIIKKVGWFDERFPGVGQEDGDYSFRMIINGLKPRFVKCDGITNYVADQVDAGWANKSKKTDGKYSLVNKEFMKKKWSTNFLDDKPLKHYKLHFYWNGELLKASPKMSNLSVSHYDTKLLETKNAQQQETNLFSLYRYKIELFPQLISHHIKQLIINIINYDRK